MKRKFIYIILGGVALIFSALIALGGRSASATPAPAPKTLAESQPLFEPLPPQSASAATAFDDAKNITTAIGASIADELIKQNPQGPNRLEGASSITARDPQELITKILTEQFEKVSPDDFRKTVLVSELKIVAGNKESYETFATKWNAIMAPFLALAIPAENPNPRDFIPLAETARTAVAQLKALLVPAEFAVAFARDLELIEMHHAIFSAIANTNTDPYRAVVGLQLLQEISNEFETRHRALAALITNAISSTPPHP